MFKILVRYHFRNIGVVDFAHERISSAHNNGKKGGEKVALTHRRPDGRAEGSGISMITPISPKFCFIDIRDASPATAVSCPDSMRVRSTRDVDSNFET